MTKSDWILPGLGAVIILYVAGTLAFWMLTKPDPAPLGAVAIAQVIITQDGIYTSTPDPTDTPAPSRTAYPTFSPTIPLSPTAENISDNVQNVPIIQYITQQVEVTRLVTFVVEQVITTTPRPTTPVPTPTVNLTQEYGLVQLTRDKQNTWLRGAAAFLGVVGCIVLAGVAVVVGIRELLPTRPTMADTRQTAEEIVRMSPVPGVTIEEYDRIRFMIAQDYSQAEMERIISMKRGKEYTGGTVHRHVKAVLDYLDQTTPPPPYDNALDGAT